MLSAQLQREMGDGNDHSVASSRRPCSPTHAMSARMMVVLICVTALFDQLMKMAALSLLHPHDPVPLLPGFNLTLGFNEGAAFGMMSGAMAGKPLLMAALTGTLTLVLAVIAFRARLPLERAGFALIVGGGLGNIIDRVRHRAVTDFLDFYWGDWHWPSFNGADIAIFLGALCVVLAAFPAGRKPEVAADAN